MVYPVLIKCPYVIKNIKLKSLSLSLPPIIHIMGENLIVSKIKFYYYI